MHQRAIPLRSRSELGPGSLYKFPQLKMWKRSFRARLPSNSFHVKTKLWCKLPSNSFLQIPTVEDVKTKLSCEPSFKFLPSNSFLQLPTLEDVKTKLWCEPSFKFLPSNSNSWRCENEALVQTSFKFLPSNSNSWRCENEAFVRDFLQIPSFKFLPSNSNSWRCENEALVQTSFKFLPSNSNSWRCENEALVRAFLQIPSFKFQPLKMWKRSFGARLPSNSFLQIPTGEVVKMMPELSVLLRGRPEHGPGRIESVPQQSAGQASPHIIRDTFCPAKHSVSCIRYLAKTHLVQDFLQIPTVEDVKTKLSCETSFKFQQLRDSDFQTFRFSDFQTFRLSGFQTFRLRLSNFLTSRLSDIQTLRYSDFQTSFRLSNFETIIPPHSKIRNTEVSLSNFLWLSYVCFWSHWLSPLGSSRFIARINLICSCWFLIGSLKTPSCKLAATTQLPALLPPTLAAPAALHLQLCLCADVCVEVLSLSACLSKDP